MIGPASSTEGANPDPAAAVAAAHQAVAVGAATFRVLGTPRATDGVPTAGGLIVAVARGDGERGLGAAVDRQRLRELGDRGGVLAGPSAFAAEEP